MATSGKNFKMALGVADEQKAHEMGLLSTPGVVSEGHPLFSSLAQRQRTPLPVPSTASQPEPRKARNYGPRRLRYRCTDKLKPWQVAMLYEADFIARQLGLPLNAFVSVCYGATFPAEAAMASTFKRAMNRMGQWMRDHGVKFAYLYTHENPEDLKPNTHLLVHVPGSLFKAFKAKAGDWFDALESGVKVEPRHDAHRQHKGLGTRLQYMAKGADDLTCRRFGGRRATGGQGPIGFKRAGVAQCLRRTSKIAAAVLGDTLNQVAGRREGDARSRGVAQRSARPE